MQSRTRDETRMWHRSLRGEGKEAGRGLPTRSFNAVGRLFLKLNGFALLLPRMIEQGSTSWSSSRFNIFKS